MRRDALLVALLEMALERLGPTLGDNGARRRRRVRPNARRRRLARTTRPTVKAAMVSVAGLLTAHGFAARAESHDSSSSVVSDNCPFGSAALHHPVLCAVDRGLIPGMLEGLGAERTTVTLTSKALGDDACRVTA